jgi:formate hydrogenlyase subunit 3/multisubunit Na+/H+ antiporter MnhD subunit
LAALWSIAILAGGGVLLLLIGRWLEARWTAWIALGLLIGAFLPFLFLRSGPQEVTLAEWMPAGPWPVFISFSFDSLTRVFALLGGLFSMLLLLWMGLAAPSEEGQYSPWVLLLLALFLHLLCHTDLLAAYAGWEMLLLATYFLLIHRRASLPTPGIAEWFLGAQHLAGYLLVAALLLIGQPSAGLRYSLLVPGVIPPAALLLLLGAAWVRTAQIPFQGWALFSAETPAPVSTMLLGGWGLLAGPYLWLRFVSRMARHTPNEVALIAGSISLIVGAVLALRQASPRRVQAGDTASRLGLLWVALGVNGPLGIAAAIFLLLDFVLSKVLFHMALSGAGRLGRPIRQTLFALAMWGAAGLPPSVGFIGRWLLVLGLLQAGRLVYLPVILLATPLTLAYLWRGWTLTASGKATARPLTVHVQKALVGVAGLVPLAGLVAAWLWRLFEPAARAVLGPAGTEVRAPLDSLLARMPGWTLLLLLIGGAGAWWSGVLRRGAPESIATTADQIDGPLQEPLPVLTRESAWAARVGQPTSLYQFAGRLLGRIGAGIQQVMTYLERHTTFFLVVVLVAATLVLIVFTR